MTDSAIDAILAQYNRPDVPGASVIVLSHGKVVYERAFGSSDLQANTRATTHTDYRLASLTKAFTAMSIMLLVKDGKLHYDDRVVDVLPGFPAYARDIRIRHLLTHTSGIVDYEDFVPDSQTTQLDDDDVLRMMHRTDTLNFAPGSAYHYSNSAYVLLGLIVQHVSGMPFPKFLHDRIFAPLHMDSTVAHVEGVSRVPDRAYGYTGDSSGHFTRTDQSSTSATLGDGGIYTSVTDMEKWSDALDHATLVDAAAMEKAWSPTMLTTGKESGYGYGWFVATVNGEKQLRHHGESTGFTNAILKYPRRELTIIVLTNRTGGDPWDIADRIASLFP
jgi:CubicO group peptidase (beta-lactamase class C family)